MKRIKDNRFAYTVELHPRAMDHFDFSSILSTGSKVASGFSSLFGSGGSSSPDNTAVQNFLASQAARDQAAAQQQPQSAAGSGLLNSWLTQDRLLIAGIALVVVVAAVSAFVLFKK